MKIVIPKHIEFALRTLKSNGFAAYIVGGCVRDALLGKEPNDWDICTSALPEQTMGVFKEYKQVISGIKHGTVCVIIDHLPIEITTFRIDGDYKDNRRPDSVTFSPTVSEDLKRRDFTINAMAYSKVEGIVDLNGGQKDLTLKIIRCVGNAETRFDEDALRIMRALRFSAQLGFKIHDDTKTAIFTKKELLKNISAERITDEFTKLILSENWFDVLKEYEAVIKVFIPHFCADFQPKQIKNDLSLRLAYILSFSKENENIFGKLKLPKIVRSNVSELIANKDIPLNDKYSVKKLLGCLGAELSYLLLDFKALFGNDVLKAPDLLNEILSNGECFLVKHLCVSGSDLLALGIENYKIGKILNELLELVMTGKLKNKKDELIAHIKRHSV